MSLVAYGSSDESSDEDEIKVASVNVNGNGNDNGNDNGSENENDNENEGITQHINILRLPPPKHNTNVSNNNIHSGNGEAFEDTTKSSEIIHFGTLPKPLSSCSYPTNIIEDDDIPPRKEIELQPEKPAKKNRAPVKITVPALSEFKDLEGDNDKGRSKIQASEKGTGLFALLPPPKCMETKTTKPLIPHVLTKSAQKSNHNKIQSLGNTQAKVPDTKKATQMSVMNSLAVSCYDSNSEDEDDVTEGTSHSSADFFSLTATESNLNTLKLSMSKIEEQPILPSVSAAADSMIENNVHVEKYSNNRLTDDVDTPNQSHTTNKTLVSNIMNLPKDEILLKNKAEIGPKLPVPEQEYNIDHEGNVAFDEKAIEYLCGKRGVKRKHKVMDEANIIEINGEDIKPDEREWLVKALTEEPAERPISMQSSGVNSQSKKKHQITYLAHQAKAMEIELKNQWAQNRMTRKQTQSKYGF